MPIPVPALMHDDGTWYVYVVRCADGSLYTGISNDAGRRVAAHNSGRGARYTKSRLPVVLVYLERASDRGDASRRESRIKRMRSEDKRRLIAGAKCYATNPPPTKRRGNTT